MFDLQADAASGGTDATVPWTSPDGLRWHKGRAIDFTGIDGEINQVTEGPHGLVAIARSGSMGLCGQYPIWIEDLWTSPDAQSWTRVDLRKAFGGAAVYDISGGPSGYVADGVAADGMTTAVWTSQDARVWQLVTLPGPVLAADEADNATAFSGGFELAAEHFTGCGNLPLVSTAVWWSRTGVDWSQSNLPASTPTTDVSVTVYPAGNSTLLALCTTSARGSKSASNSFWTSGDGVSWKRVSGPRLPADGHAVLSFGERALVASWTASWRSEVPVPPVILAFSAGGNLVALKQAGTAPQFLPDDSGGVGYVPLPNAALGPSGLVVTDGSSIWIGTLTAV